MKWFLIVVASYQGSWNHTYESKSEMPDLETCLSVLAETKTSLTNSAQKGGGFVVAYCAPNEDTP